MTKRRKGEAYIGGHTVVGPESRWFSNTGKSSGPITLAWATSWRDRSAKMIRNLEDRREALKNANASSETLTNIDTELREWRLKLLQAKRAVTRLQTRVPKG